MDTQGKQFTARCILNPLTERELQASFKAEEAAYQLERRNYIERMNNRKEVSRIEAMLKDARSQLQQTKKEKKRIDAVVTAMYAAKYVTLRQLGDGKKNGGTKENQKSRFVVMDRVRSVAHLTPAQEAQWVAFRISWDEIMAGLHQDKWGKLFSEMMMALLSDIADGKIEALSAFVEDEKSRVLHNVPMLCLPDAAPLQLD